MFQPRPKQAEVLEYTGGMMGVAAVPGSGKTQTLSYLTAQLVAGGTMAVDQEVLVVTLVNSAVDNFVRRVHGFVRERGLLPGVGYTVRTLHGIAHDIVRERPSLVGLAEDFAIVDERETQQILADAVRAWVLSNPDAADRFLIPARDDGHASWLKREPWPGLVTSIATAVVRLAKDLRLGAPELATLLAALEEPPPLLALGQAVYADYQHALSYRGAVDFQDLIRLALLALESDPDYLMRLRHRWPYILEDEAQDSSHLQEAILRLLAGAEGNWVRVGDPNQAIFESFTTASPRFLRDFLREPNVAARELPNSGRSTASIIALANHLVAWSRADHPTPELRDALAPTLILPTPEGDPQPNPPDDPEGVKLVRVKFEPDREIATVVEHIARWLPENPDATVAVLALRNDRGELFVEALRKASLGVIELLRSTSDTRNVAGALGTVLGYVADPGSAEKLKKAWNVWRRGDREDKALAEQSRAVAGALGKVGHPESLLWPRPDPDSLEALAVPAGLEDVSDVVTRQVVDFRALVRRWQGAAVLPIDQLILTIAGDIFDRPADLALAYKLASVLGGFATSNPDWRLARMLDELKSIALQQRKFLGFSDDDTGFDPDRHRGKVVVTTMHKAKGLEWDRVYLTSVNSYDFPSGMAGDTFQSERYFIRDGLNLEAEALAQLAALRDGAPLPPEGEPSRQARLDISAERLRLFYVGITRARRELVITWNAGRKGDSQPAAPLIALWNWWSERQAELEATAAPSTPDRRGAEI